MGKSSVIDVEWLVDTGSSISVIWNSLGSLFDVQSVALTAGGTTGGGGIQVTTGITTEFQVQDARGVVTTVQTSRYVGIKSTDAASNILGMDAVAAVGATVVWNPAFETGMLGL